MKILKPRVNIVCLKAGTKYSSSDVNRLYKMVKKNTSLPFSFYCITEDSKDLNDEINVISLDESLELETWWWKTLLFSNILPPNIPTLYFDVEVVIQNNIDSLFDGITDDKIITIKLEDTGSTATTDSLKYPSYINSSIMGFISGQHKIIFNTFMNNPDHYILDYVGMDRFITRKFLDRINFLTFPNDYYFRHGNVSNMEHYRDGYGYLMIRHSKVCVIKQISTLREPYEGLEEYFL